MRATYSLILSFTPLPTFAFGLIRVLAFSLVEADGRELLGQSFHFLLQRGNRRELLGLQNLLEVPKLLPFNFFTNFNRNIDAFLDVIRNLNKVFLGETSRRQRRRT